MMTKTLRKSATDKKISGVCGGIAEYFNIDATIVRIILVAFTLFGGSGILVYIVAALIMPEALPYDPPTDDPPSNNWNN